MRTVEFKRAGFTIFARILGEASAPALLYLQGGPGFPAPRERFAWITAALARGYQVVLLDQRGTGRSTRIDAHTPSLIDVSVLTQLRANDIVSDAEALREELGLARWDVLGQSFGGFCLMHYLAAHPESVGRALFTGGVPSIGEGADGVYRATFAKLKRRHLQFNEQYPAAEQLGLTQQHFASRVHWRLPEKGRELRGSAASLASRSCPAQLTWRSGLPAKNAVAFSAS